MDVGVRELKQHLSEYLDRAANGEIIRVTDRGCPKAYLGPITDDGWLGRGVDEGWIRPPQRSGLRAARRFTAERRSNDVLAEDRAE